MMMAYLRGTGSCFVCHKIFSFDAYKVPTITMRGVKKPVCRGCVDELNAKRARQGKKPVEYLPGAYGPEPPEAV